MGVVWCKELALEEGSDDLDSNITYRRTFQVVTSTAQDGAPVVLAWHELPQLNEIYSYVNETIPLAPLPVTDPFSVVVKRRAERSDPENLQNWTVTVDYAGVEDPAAVPAEVEYSPTRYQKALVVDVNGVPVNNSADDPFEGGVLADRTRFTITIVKNVPDADWNPIEADEFQDSLNELPFLAGKFPSRPDGFPPGTCKLVMGAKRERQLGTAAFYWRRTATIEVDLAGWKAKPRDAGFRAKVSGPTVYNIVDPDGTRPATPRLLDGSGFELSAGATPVIAGPLGAGFDVYLTKNWVDLNLEY